MDIKLFVVTHKEVENLPSDRTVIGVGGNRNLKCAEVFDNTGDNIADKNSSFCELTALYWIWKNDNSDCAGLEHYRRFFCGKNIFKAKILTKKRVNKILQKHDVIVAKKSKCKPSLSAHYAKEHCREDLNICLDIIERDFPDYVEDCKAVLNSHRASMYNMFVMPKNLLDEYCEWLFRILFSAEKEINLEDKDDYQKRVFGFLSERLFNVWLHHKKLNCYYSWIYNIGDSPLILKFKGLFRRIKKLFKKK